jgi:predicted DNA binding protein
MRISSDYIYYKNNSMEAAFSLKDHREFRALLGYFKEAGVGFKVLEVKMATSDASGDGVGEPSLAAYANLTPKQLEILRHAYRSGYFDRDRKVNLGEIARHFGLSPATVGVHMRVGLKKILKNIV